MFASVVTLTHNKLDVTRKCLPTLLKSTCPDWELIVVDNGSSDGTVDWLQRFQADAAGAGVALRIIRNGSNIGCSTARNRGAAEARCSRLVFIDNDVALRSPDWLQELARPLERPATAVAGPKLVYPFPPHHIQCAGVAVARSGRVQFRGRGEPRDDPRFAVAQPVQCLISACFMVRRDAFEDAGGFDPAFNPVEYEDFDLCYRMRAAGQVAVYVPTVEMYHFESVTTAGTAALPNTYLIIKHGLLFKQRWRHMFETEDGPPDHETRWKSLSLPPFETVKDLPLLQKHPTAHDASP